MGESLLGHKVADEDEDNDDDVDDYEDDDDLNLLAPCQQLTSTLASGLPARLDRIHMPENPSVTVFF